MPNGVAKVDGNRKAGSWPAPVTPFGLDEIALFLGIAHPSLVDDLSSTLSLLPTIKIFWRRDMLNLGACLILSRRIGGISTAP
jgi:hypothetical protein